MNQPDNPTERIPPSELKVDPEAEDLVESPAMKPYMNLALAMMQGGDKDIVAATAEIAALPLEQRYVWRVASALKWAFADLETVSIEVDRETLSPEDRERLIPVLRPRPLQFCLFLSALFGQKEMEALMVSALKQCRALAEST